MDQRSKSVIYGSGKGKTACQSDLRRYFARFSPLLPTKDGVFPIPQIQPRFASDMRGELSCLALYVGSLVHMNVVDGVRILALSDGSFIRADGRLRGMLL